MTPINCTSILVGVDYL